jgi:hypothetical protein
MVSSGAMRGGASNNRRCCTGTSVGAFGLALTACGDAGASAGTAPVLAAPVEILAGDDAASSSRPARNGKQNRSVTSGVASTGVYSIAPPVNAAQPARAGNCRAPSRPSHSRGSSASTRRDTDDSDASRQSAAKFLGPGRTDYQQVPGVQPDRCNHHEGDVRELGGEKARVVCLHQWSLSARIATQATTNG